MTLFAGPATHKDDPPGVDVDPNQVPPADDQKGTDKVGSSLFHSVLASANALPLIRASNT